MQLKVIGSGSSGNSYVLENETEALIIEAGLPFLEVKKALNFNIMKIVGVIVSHEHLDHAQYIKQYMRAGISVYTAFETQTALEVITGERTTAIPPLKKCQIGKFTITPFNVPHDTDIECYGYLIEHDEMGKLLFMTDLEYCKYNFSKQGINHILIESNYSMDLVDRDEPNYEHRLRGHMSLNTALKFISTNDNPLLLNVVLIHLSDKSGDPAQFTEEMKKTIEYGANVYVARKGLEVNLNLCPF